MRQRLFALTLAIVVAAILAVLYLALRPPASEIVLPALPTDSASSDVDTDTPLASANLPAPEPAPEPAPVPEETSRVPTLPADRTGMVIVPGGPNAPKEKALAPLPNLLDVTLKGEVVDAAGRAVADADVHITGAVSADKYLRKGPSKLLARTGLDGKFEGKYSLQRGSVYELTLYAEVGLLKSEPMVIGVVPGDTYDDILIRMPQTGSITGCVVDMRQNPIAGARVTAGLEPTRQEGKVTLHMGTYHPYATETDANGCFTLDGLPPGDYEVDGSAADFVANQVIATVRPGDVTDIGFELFLGVPIYLKAQLQCSTRQPKGKLTITFFDAEGQSIEQRGKADENGLLLDADFPYFSTSLSIQMPGYLPTERLALPAPSDDWIVDLGRVTLVASGEVPD